MYVTKFPHMKLARTISEENKGCVKVKFLFF